jgi:hypothetical protein
MAKAHALIQAKNAVKYSRSVYSIGTYLQFFGNHFNIYPNYDWMFYSKIHSKNVIPYTVITSDTTKMRNS